MAVPTLLSCAVLIALIPHGSAQPDDGSSEGLPGFHVCNVDEIYEAMEKTCAHPYADTVRPLNGEFDRIPSVTKLWISSCPKLRTHCMSFRPCRQRFSLILGMTL